MATKEIIQSWKWRIVKAGHTAKSFAELIEISPSLLSEYWSGAKSPSIERFDLIENKLRELGV